MALGLDASCQGKVVSVQLRHRLRDKKAIKPHLTEALIGLDPERL
jgi:hypothetical protein